MNRNADNAAAELGAEGWVKPWSGSGGGNCVEVKPLGGARVAMRQSTEPDGAALILSSDAMSAFVRAAKAGELDFLTD